MLLNGEKIEGPNVEVLVLPRGNNRPDVVFHFQAIIDNSPFEKMCPMPQPPVRIMKGGKKDPNFEDAGYKSEVALYHEKRIAWIVLESLKATPGLAWETVKADDHTTWIGYEKELKESGFSYIEVQRIQNSAFSANSLNESLVEEARKSFLLGLEAPSKA